MKTEIAKTKTIKEEVVNYLTKGTKVSFKAHPYITKIEKEFTNLEWYQLPNETTQWLGKKNNGDKIVSVDVIGKCFYIERDFFGWETEDNKYLKLMIQLLNVYFQIKYFDGEKYELYDWAVWEMGKKQINLEYLNASRPKFKYKDIAEIKRLINLSIASKTKMNDDLNTLNNELDLVLTGLNKTLLNKNHFRFTNKDNIAHFAIENNNLVYIGWEEIAYPLYFKFNFDADKLFRDLIIWKIEQIYNIKVK